MEKIVLSVWALWLTGMVLETKAIAGFKISRSGGLVSSYQPDSYTEEMHTAAIPQIMNDIISGPLKGRYAVLMCPRHLDVCSEVVEDLLRINKTPVTIHFLPDDASHRNELEHPSGTHSVEEATSGVAEFDSFYSSYKTSVLIMLVTSREESWWPFRNPPDHWQARAIMLITTSPSCMTQDFLVTPLLHQTPAVAMLCPHVPQNASATGPMFKTWTWLPYSSGQRLIDIGIWDSNRIQEWNDLFVDRFGDMSLKQINIAANPLDPPYFFEKEDGTLAGVTLLIVKSLSSWLRYKYNIESSTSINVTLTDELLQSGKNDLKINAAAPTLERDQKFLISTPYGYQGFGLILQLPPPIPRWQNILYPFTWTVWLWIALSIIFTSVSFHLLYYEHQRSFVTNSLTVVQFLLSNPLASVPDSWRIRCLLLPWWIGSWLISLSYTCNLIAILTVPVFPGKIKTILQLAESNFRLCMLDYGEFVPEALTSSTHPVLKALGDKLDMVPVLEFMPDMGEEQCAERVVAGTHAHLEGYTYAKTFYDRIGLGNRVYVIDEVVYPSYLSLVLHKHSPWKYKYDLGMGRLREAGLMDKWYNDYMAKYEEKEEKEDASSSLRLTPLTLQHLQGSFLLHLGGVIFGLLILTVEVAIAKA